jgi:peptidoglycan/LPS O-acetylase OafA/YrhL
LGHRPALDGVRALAILAVLGYHFHDALPTRGGFLGVEIFFVLSGFLITSILLEEHTRRGVVSFRRFYVRRVRRLLPALVVVAAAIAAYVVIVRPATSGATLRELVPALLYVDNWYQAFAEPPQTMIGHAWSLAVEEQFYLVWPVVLLFALRRGWRTALAVAIGGTLVFAAIRAAEWELGASARYVYCAWEGRAPALLLGCALAIMASRGLLDGRAARRAGTLALGPALVVIAAGLVGVDVSAGLLYGGGLTIFSLAVTVVLANLVMWPGPLNAMFEWAPVVWVGQISYGLYLWHQPIYFATGDHVASNTVAVAIALPASFLAAALSARFVERPFRSRAARPAPAPAPAIRVPAPAEPQPAAA